MAADTAPSSGKGVRYGAFGGGGVTAMVVEVLLGVGGFDVERGAEMTMFKMTSTSRKVTWEGEADGILTVELFKEICEGVGPMRPE